MSKSTAAPPPSPPPSSILQTPSSPSSPPPPYPEPTPARHRAYSPRVTGKTKDTLVKQKELELRDARMLTRLIKEVRDLSPWGLGQLKQMMQDMGPIQPEIAARFRSAGARTSSSLPESCPMSHKPLSETTP